MTRRDPIEIIKVAKGTFCTKSPLPPTNSSSIYPPTIRPNNRRRTFHFSSAGKHSQPANCGYCEKKLRHVNNKVRAAAIFALRLIDSSASAWLLKETLNSDPSADVRLQVIRTIDFQPRPRYLRPLMISIIHDPSADVRQAIAALLKRHYFTRNEVQSLLRRVNPNDADP